MCFPSDVIRRDKTSILPYRYNMTSLLQTYVCYTKLKNRIIELASLSYRSFMIMVFLKNFSTTHVYGNSRREYENTEIKDNGMLEGFVTQKN